ncbi:unnamed protein product [Xylocopa violacea]|uniref:Uncharacterized protein n=1 Tax=Xylocopa violacea TaxID=135666 RepID=A0ABP1NYS3_XYLVO
MMSRQSKDPVQKCHSDPGAASTAGTPCSPGKRISRRLVPGIPSSSNTRKCVLTLDGYSYVIGRRSISRCSKCGLRCRQKPVKTSSANERKTNGAKKETCRMEEVGEKGSRVIFSVVALFPSNWLMHTYRVFVKDGPPLWGPFEKKIVARFGYY